MDEAMCPDCGIPLVWCRRVSSNAKHCWRWDYERFDEIASQLETDRDEGWRQHNRSEIQRLEAVAERDALKRDVERLQGALEVAVDGAKRITELMEDVVAHLENYDGDYENAEKLVVALGLIKTERDALEREIERLREALGQAVDDLEACNAAHGQSLGSLQAEANISHYRHVLSSATTGEES